VIQSFNEMARQGRNTAKICGSELEITIYRYKDEIIIINTI